MEYIIKEETANKVLNYLATKPYMEVAQIIAELSKLEKKDLITNEK